MSDGVNGFGFMLERRVPLAVVAALLLQTGGALIWAGAASERISVLENEMLDKPVLMDRTARLEEQTIHVRESLARIEARLERLTETPRENTP